MDGRVVDADPIARWSMREPEQGAADYRKGKGAEVVSLS
uniref:Uncharacterized protein n=1 Tax=Nonomuraea gerenzanensis TaxID=93944 RepID=A0A1M4EHK4_9ACTN|nr:hypothetical protein BN4615_P7953 [Nonomuraea gerenzanensis]